MKSTSVRSDGELPELVRDSKLDVIVQGSTAVHNTPLGCRNSVLPQKWEWAENLGSGGEGLVILQKKIEGPGDVNTIAVKQIFLESEIASSDHKSKRYRRELEALAKFAQDRYTHYFVRSYGWYHDRNMLYICMEYCEHLDLGKYLRDHGTLSEELAKIISGQILGGLCRMHDNKFAHRDLKPTNILIKTKTPPDSAWWVVLGDLGLSRRSGDSSGTTSIHGSQGFMAPETIGEPFGGNPKDADALRADMWSLGATISSALTGCSVFLDNMQLLQYQKGDIDFPDSTLKDSHVSGCAIDFIRSLMRIEPSQRLTAKKALDHSWFAVSNVSQTHTHIASAIKMTDEFMPATSLHQIQAPTIHDVNDEAVVLEKREFPTSTQTTEASAKWTETIPIRSEDTQASGMWTETVADPATRKGHSALHHRLSVLQRTPETVIAKRKETSDDSRVPGTILPWYPNKYLGQDPDVERGAEQRETADRKRHLKETARMLQAADLSNRARAFRRENKSPDLDDLKKFSQNFKLSTPVPSSLLPRGSNDEKRPLLDEAYPKRYTPVHKSNVEEDYESTQRANLVKAEMQRQPYSNAPPSSSLHSSLLPPPAGLRPRSLSASKSTQSKSRPQSQTLPYTVSQTHVPEGKAPMPNQWEEAPRIQEDIAQSTLQKPEADSKPRVLLKGQCCKLCVR